MYFKQAFPGTNFGKLIQSYNEQTNYLIVFYDLEGGMLRNDEEKPLTEQAYLVVGMTDINNKWFTPIDRSLKDNKFREYNVENLNLRNVNKFLLHAKARYHADYIILLAWNSHRFDSKVIDRKLKEEKLEITKYIKHGDPLKWVQFMDKNIPNFKLPGGNKLKKVVATYGLLGFKAHIAQFDTEYLIRIFILRVGEYFIFKEAKKQEFKHINQLRESYRNLIVNLYNEVDSQYKQEEIKTFSKISQHNIWKDLLF